MTSPVTLADHYHPPPPPPPRPEDTWLHHSVYVPRREYRRPSLGFDATSARDLAEILCALDYKLVRRIPVSWFEYIIITSLDQHYITVHVSPFITSLHQHYITVHVSIYYIITSALHHSPNNSLLHHLLDCLLLPLV